MPLCQALVLEEPEGEKRGYALVRFLLPNVYASRQGSILSPGERKGLRASALYTLRSYACWQERGVENDVATLAKHSGESS